MSIQLDTHKKHRHPNIKATELFQQGVSSCVMRRMKVPKFLYFKKLCIFYIAFILIVEWCKNHDKKLLGWLISHLICDKQS